MNHKESIMLIMELRRFGVTDNALLNAIETMPIKDFPPEPFVNIIKENIGFDAYKGKEAKRVQAVAMMLNDLKVGDEDKILEIGTASGYQTSILANLGKRVYSIAKDSDERQKALSILSNKNIIISEKYSFCQGWKEQAPFDRIISNVCCL